MIRIVVIYLLTLLFSSNVSATVQNTKEKVTGHLLEYGIVKMSNQEIRYEVPAQPGKYSINSEIQFIKTTDQIPLVKGTAFGIGWAITGLNEKNIEVIYSVEHPEITLENGEKSIVLKEKMKHTVILGVAGSVDGYVLNHDYELVPGDWKVIIQYKDIEISKTFKVQ